MKKAIFSFTAIVFAIGSAVAQNYDEVRNFLLLNQNKKAKELLDKNWSNPKFTAKPDAYILKTAVLAALSADPTMTAQAPALREEAMTSLAKYQEMDPKMTLLTDKNSAYLNSVATLYQGYFNQAIGDYNAKKWPEAFTGFKNAVALTDLKDVKILSANALDTNGILLAGASAQAMKNDAEAMKYFGRLAEAKIGGKDNEFMYQYLTGTYLNKGDIANFNKYLALGRQLYPDSKYFKYEEIDFILGMEDETLKTKLINEKFKSDPNNYKLQSAVGEMLFDELNPRDTSTPMPANYDEKEAMMVQAFTKATELNPTVGLAMSNLGNHFINKSVKASKEVQAFQAYLRDKAKTPAPKPAPAKPGTKPAPAAKPATDPADIAKRDALFKVYDDNIDKARAAYEKAAEIYGAKTAGSLNSIEKQQYKNAVSYLIDIYAEKKNNNKSKPAESAKFEKEEKKWSDVYSKL